MVRQAKADGAPVAAGRMRWALLKDPMKLSGDQRTTLAEITRINAPIYRAYLIKEQVREAFKIKGEKGKALPRGCDLLGQTLPPARDGRTRPHPDHLPGDHRQRPDSAPGQRARRCHEHPRPGP